MPQNVASNYSPLVAWAGQGWDLQSFAGLPVNERSAMSLSAFYRAVSLISGTLASLPLNSYRTDVAGRPEKVSSIFDNPDPDSTPYEWKQTAFVHLLVHGKCGALKQRNEAGGLAALPLVQPELFQERIPTPSEIRRGERPAGGLWFDVQLEDGSHRRLDANDFFYVPGLSLDGRTGVSLLTYARMSLGTTAAGDRGAAQAFSRGAMIAGIASIDDDDGLEPDEFRKVREELDRTVLGYENAGNIPLINRRVKFMPWQMSMADAQFLQSRQFQIEEIARWTGVPPHLLMQTDKQTSWGTGVDEQNRALGRTVLNPWAQRFEQRGSKLLANPRWCEFDFTTLERPSPDREVEIDLSQVNAGVMTIDEYRAKRGWAPLAEQGVTDAPTD